MELMRLHLSVRLGRWCREVGRRQGRKSGDKQDLVGRGAQF